MHSSTYTPDHWIIIRLSTPKYGTVYKILCSWSGSYMYGESWKLSSGILTFEENEEKGLYMSKQESGSIYVLRKVSEEMSSIMLGIYQNTLIEVQKCSGSAEIIESKDYLEMVQNGDYHGSN